VILILAILRSLSLAYKHVGGLYNADVESCGTGRYHVGYWHSHRLEESYLTGHSEMSMKGEKGNHALRVKGMMTVLSHCGDSRTTGLWRTALDICE
jgi:hypothetical protein